MDHEVSGDRALFQKSIKAYTGVADLSSSYCIVIQHPDLSIMHALAFYRSATKKEIETALERCVSNDINCIRQKQT